MFRRFFFKIKKFLFKKKPSTPVIVAPEERPDRGSTPFDVVHPDSIYINDIPILKGSYSFNPKDKNALIFGHVTAGWQKQKPKDFFAYMARMGYFTDFIDIHGNIFQQGEGDETGPHVGKSEWVDYRGKKLKNLNRYSRGVEMACGGKLRIWKNGKSKYWSKKDIPHGYTLKTGFGKTVEPENMRYVTTSMGYRHSGWFEILKPAQEEGYAKWILGWLKKGVNPLRSLEHADASPDRRSDIGGCLSMPHDEFVRVKVLPEYNRWLQSNG